MLRHAIMLTTQNVLENPEIIVCFDGFCLFCSAMARFTYARDKYHVIYFAALQSEPGRKLLQRFPRAPEKPSSLIVIERDRMYSGADAALQVARRLSGYWPLLYFLKIIPAPIRDFLYEQFALRRYGWFGKSNVCFTPDGPLRERFLT